MCGEAMVQAYGGWKTPPVCVQLMEGSDDVDADAIAGKVTVDLCEECASIGRRMAMDYETSPLPECNAKAARWQSVGMAQALAGEEVGENGELTDRMLENALMTVKADVDGSSDHILDSKIAEAYVILVSLQQLGKVETDLIGREGDGS